MDNYPASPSEYGSLDGVPDNWKEFLEENHDELTVDQLRKCCNYLEERCREFREKLESDITIKDFEDAKKEEVDGDEGEGEKESY